MSEGVAQASNPTSTGAGRRRKRSRDPDDLRVQVRHRGHKDLPWSQVFRFLVRLMARHPFAMAGMFLLTILLALAEVFAFSLFLPFLDAVRGEGSASVAEGTALGFLVPLFEGMSVVDKIRMVAVLLFVTELVKALLLYLMTRIAQYIHIMVGRDLRTMVFDDIMAADMGFLNKERTSNLFTIVHSFPNAASRIVDQLMMGLQNFTSFAALVVMLLLLSPKLTILTAVMALLVSLVVIQLSRVVRARAVEIKDSRLRMHQTTLESLSAMKLIRVFGRTGQARERFLHHLQDLQRNQWRKAKISSIVSPLYTVLSTLMIVTVLIGGTILLNRDADYWVATLAAFMAVTFRFMSRSGRYAKRKTAIAAELPAMEAVIQFLERDDKRKMTDGTVTYKGLRQGVRFEDVRFRYDASEPDVIRGVTLDVPRGQTVAIVGASGAGKSTLIDLLARLYDPQTGRILVDGVDVREFVADTWRRRIAVVSQETFLFNDTVRENLRFGRPHATDAAIEEAARMANAHDFIQALPDGYDTPLGDRGVRLSGGQAQRIAIARAILAEPDVLVLDEATSALDAATEYQVQTAIDRVTRDRTIIAIAHRLATVRKADTIIVLEDGEIVEQGTHDQLLAKEGHYHRYVRMQDLLDDNGDAFAALAAEGLALAEDTDDSFLFEIDMEDVLLARDEESWSGLDWPEPAEAGPAAHDDQNEAPHRVHFALTLDQDAERFVQPARGLDVVLAARAEGKRLIVAAMVAGHAVPALFELVRGSGARVRTFDARIPGRKAVKATTPARRT